MPTADHVDPPFLPKREAVVETLPRRASVPGRALRNVLAEGWDPQSCMGLQLRCRSYKQSAGADETPFRTRPLPAWS